MKEMFDREAEILSAREEVALWEGIRRRLPRRRTHVLSWLVPAGAVTALAVIWFLQRDVPKELLVAPPGPEEMSQAGDGSPSAESPPTPPAPIGPAEDSTGALAGLPEEPSRTPADSLSAPLLSAIQGTVTSSQGPEAYVTVLVEGTEFGAMTDAAGRFRIEGVPPGSHDLKVLKMGFDSERGIVDLASGSEVTRDFTLRETVVAQTREINVIGQKQRIELGSTATRQSVSSNRSLSLAPPSAGQHFRGGRASEALSTIDVRVPSGQPGDGFPNSVGGTDPVNGQAFDAMFFEHYGVNPFIDPEDDRLATFAVDVDNASYGMTRAYLDRGELPPKDAVRVEEFVNAVRHDYEPPGPEFASRGDVPSERGTFAIYLDGAPSPFGRNLTLLRVGLKGREVDVEDRKPAVLTFLVDVSGSMAREDRLELVKKALRMLLDRMERDDEVGLVVYGSTARTILPHTSLHERRRIEEAIQQLSPEGSTNAEAGLQEAYRLAGEGYRSGRINRIILCSDGVANVGLTSAEDILERIGQAAARGIELSTIGFGMGNYNDVLMEKLANRGDGNYHYVDDLKEAHRVFVENLTGTLQTIAREVKIQVEFNPEAVERYRLLGYENRDVADHDFRNDAVDAGEVGAGHEVTALFEVKVAPEARGEALATVRVRYQEPGGSEVVEESRTFRARDVEQSLSDAPPSLRLDAAAAEFAEILRHSYWAKGGDLRQVSDMARQAWKGVEDRGGAAELVRLVEKAAELWAATGPEVEGERVRPRWEPE